MSPQNSQIFNPWFRVSKPRSSIIATSLYWIAKGVNLMGIANIKTNLLS
jgi:hypothetical protein